MQKVLITSALPYVNNVPHLGNIIGCVLSGDVFARYKRDMGFDVMYLCGTDEYGTTTEVKAKEENLTCQQICDKYSTIHKNIYDWFNINFDVWGRTSTETQTKITHDIFLKLWKNGHINERTISQFYCNTCEMFLADRYVRGICYHPECENKNSTSKGDQCDVCSRLIETVKLIDPYCNTCKNTPSLKQSDHLFLKLGDFQEQLKEYTPNVTLDGISKSITEHWLNIKLEDRCITRDLKWGTPMPQIDELVKYHDKVFYVWFDAPIGYISILAHHFQDDRWKEWFMNDDVKLYQFMAKDNVSFHSIIFPATLMGTNDPYRLLTNLCAVEYLNYEGDKFSKSENKGIFGDQVMEISKKLNITSDAWRFYLLWIRPENSDTSFHWDQFVQTYNSQLADNYGNFVNRVIVMSKKYCNNKLKIESFDDTNVIYPINNALNKYHQCMENVKLKEALKTVLTICDIGNQFLNAKEPWNVYKKYNNDDAIPYIMSFTFTIMLYVTILLKPFIPDTTTRLLKRIGMYDIKISDLKSFECLFKTHTLSDEKPEILFHKLDKLN